MPKPILFLAMCLSLFGGMCNAYIWYLLNKHLTPETNFSICYFAWSCSRIFRYLPGKVFSYIVRQKLQKSSLKHGIKSSINEILLTFMTLMILSSSYFLINLQKEYSLYFLIFSVLTYIIILYIKVISRFFEETLLKFNISLTFSRLFNHPKTLYIQSLYGLPALLFHGGSFYLIIRYGTGASPVEFLYSTISFYFSGLIGQLSLISPAGLGVKEASLTFFMIQSGFTAEIAIVAALASRVILVISEITNIIFAYLLRYLKSYG